MYILTMDDKIKQNLRDEKAERETVLLRKYKEPVIRILKDLRDRRELSHVAKEKLDGMKTVRLTEIHTGARELTPYYLAKFAKGGIVSLDSILQGRKLEDLPREEKILLMKIFAPDEETELLWEAKNKGVNVVAYLRQLLGKNE